MCRCRNGDTIDFAYQITKRFVGDELPIKVLRNGDVVEAQLKLERNNYVVPAHMVSCERWVNSQE